MRSCVTSDVNVYEGNMGLTSVDTERSIGSNSSDDRGREANEGCLYPSHCEPCTRRRMEVSTRAMGTQTPGLAGSEKRSDADLWRWHDRAALQRVDFDSGSG
jgi:hypothetical protein